jgi:hypothetical protein
MAITKFKGVEIEFGGGTTYVVPALTLRSVQALQDRLSAYTGSLDAESIETVVDTVHAALTRNYPKLSRDDVADMLDLRNMGDVMKAVIGQSGLVEAEPLGEAMATASTGSN